MILIFLVLISEQHQFLEKGFMNLFWLSWWRGQLGPVVGDEVPWRRQCQVLLPSIVINKIYWFQVLTIVELLEECISTLFLNHQNIIQF